MAGLFRSVALSLIVLLTVFVAGCGNPLQPFDGNSNNSAATVKKDKLTPPKTVAVIMGRLVALHPLQTDIARLANIENRLRGLAQKPFAEEGPDKLTLPALPNGETIDNRPVARRADLLKARLEAEAGRRVESFEQDLLLRQDQVLSRRRADLEKGMARRLGEERRLAHEDAYIAVRQKLIDLSLPLANLEIQRQSLRANLAIVPPEDDLEKLRAEITALLADNNRKYASERARFEAGLERNALSRAELKAQVTTILAQADADVEKRVAALETVLRGEIAQEIAKLRQAFRTGLAERARQSRRTDLLAEAAHSLGAPMLLSSPGAAVYRQEIAVESVVNPPDVALAVAKVTRQRQDLERFVIADIRAAVDDLSKAGNLRVVYIEDEVKPTQDDRTDYFANRLRQEYGASAK